MTIVQGSSSRALWLLVKRIAAVVLLAFHAVLLWNRVLDGSFAEPQVLAKWIASIALFAALLSVRNMRGAVVVVWLLIALLHVGGLPAEIVLVLLVLAITTSAGFVPALSSFAPPVVLISRDRPRGRQFGRSPPAA